jgi:hypothetical protein
MIFVKWDRRRWFLSAIQTILRERPYVMWETAVCTGGGAAGWNVSLLITRLVENCVVSRCPDAEKTSRLIVLIQFLTY